MNYKESIAFIEYSENQKRQKNNKRMKRSMTFLFAIIMLVTQLGIGNLHVYASEAIGNGFDGDDIIAEIDDDIVAPEGAEVIDCKQIEKGEGISYQHNYITDGNGYYLTCAIGYADGYHRVLSGKAPMIVCGQRVNTIGRICMDQTMLDVTNVPNVKEGDICPKCGEHYLYPVLPSQED